MAREPQPRPVLIELQQVSLLHQIPYHRKPGSVSHGLYRQAHDPIRRLHETPSERREDFTVSRLRHECQRRAGVDDGAAVAELVDDPNGRANRLRNGGVSDGEVASGRRGYACVQRRRLLREEPAGDGPVRVGILVSTRAVDPGMVTVVTGFRVGDEAAGRVVAMVGGECGGVAGEEGGSGWAVGAVAAGGALDPDEIAAGVGDEEEALRRSADSEIDEVLAGAGGGAGDEGGFEGGAAVEGGETVEVGGEKVGGRG
ncbi:glycine-rich cell wall structural protein 1.0-like [Senna tora]|uniref:Glycine-rich cell wall structural protein 1.0-like n=1 Tax=Senna tora TaxID=362788 RepID=A0A834TSV9_9FABA|nr:glycine-rich cell wall structural protein 1.0-like [Senna tora]